MEETKKFILSNKESFELYDYLNDYQVLFKAIEEKVTADHCIEACKAFLEGLAKTIISEVDLRSEETKKRFEDKDWDNLSTLKSQIDGRNAKFQELVRQSILVLAAFHHSCEKDFLLGFTSKYFSTIAKLRDKRGDVSHGRQVPKNDKSSLVLAGMVESITDVIATHMLEVFVLIDFDVDKKGDAIDFIKESFEIKPESDYESFHEREKFIRTFNKQLDEENPILGGLSYSEALYFQKQNDYLMMLAEYELELQSDLN